VRQSFLSAGRRACRLGARRFSGALSPIAPYQPAWCDLPGCHAACLAIGVIAGRERIVDAVGPRLHDENPTKPRCSRPVESRRHPRSVGGSGQNARARSAPPGMAVACSAWANAARRRRRGSRTMTSSRRSAQLASIHVHWCSRSQRPRRACPRHRRARSIPSACTRSVSAVGNVQGGGPYGSNRPMTWTVPHAVHCG
jgi:hypothetical protein